MQIIEATIHRLQKAAHTSGQGSVTTQIRDTPLPIDDTLEGVCRDLLALYHRSNDSSGTFGANPNLHVFPLRLREYFTQQLSFQELTEAAVQLVAAKMEGARLSNGGYALFLRYTEAPNDFLLIAMLKLKPGAGIDEDSLALMATLSIDLDLLNEAARINLTRLQAREEPYLTFIKGARKKAEITEYFRDALSCMNYTNASEQTKQLIAAADDFVAQRDDLPTDELKQHEKLEARRRLYDCLKANPSEVTLSTVAAAINPGEPEEFITFSKAVVDGERKYRFDDRFKPDAKVTQTLRRIKGSIGTIRVSFDVDDVRSGTVAYDAAQDAIVIKRPPTGLRQEILDHVDDDPN